MVRFRLIDSARIVPYKEVPSIRINQFECLMFNQKISGVDLGKLHGQNVEGLVVSTAITLLLLHNRPSDLKVTP